MIILDGKKTSNDIKEEIADEVKSIIFSGGRIPHLSAILVGNDGASETYVNSKSKGPEQVGFKSTLIRLQIVLLKKNYYLKWKKSIIIRILMG